MLKENVNKLYTGFTKLKFYKNHNRLKDRVTLVPIQYHNIIPTSK